MFWYALTQSISFLAMALVCASYRYFRGKG
jgi:hypothetical protein